jgi:hypothetical protein
MMLKYIPFILSILFTIVIYFFMEDVHEKSFHTCEVTSLNLPKNHTIFFGMLYHTVNCDCGFYTSKETITNSDFIGLKVGDKIIVKNPNYFIYYIYLVLYTLSSSMVFVQALYYLKIIKNNYE